MYPGYDDGRQDSPLLSLDQWNDSLLAASFDGIEVSGDDYGGEVQMTTMMVSKAIAPSEKLASPGVAIIAKPSTYLNNFASELSSTLGVKGLQTSIETWSSYRNDDSLVYVVLDDSSNPILANPSPSVFVQRTKLVSQANSIFWISVPGGSAARNSEKDLVVSQARTARKENGGKKFITFELQEHIKESSASIMEKISDILSASFYTPLGQRSEEFEYTYNGQVLIPRLIPNFKLDS